MATVQSFLTYSNSSVANYTNWAQGIGSALNTLGWSKVSDTAGVVWANIVSLTNVPQFGCPLGGIITSGAWSAGTSYTGGTPSISSQTNFNIVTNSGLTYACVLSTQQSSTVQALQNSAATLTITAVAAASLGVAVYTVSSGVTSSMIGQQFILSIGGSNLLGNNAGTFVCTNTSGTTSITFGNPNATAQASVTGGTPTAVSSTTVISFIGANSTQNWTNLASNNAPSNGFTTVNALVGHSLTVAGYTAGAAGNNGTYTVTSNAAVTNVTNNATFCATFTGTNATQANVTVTEATAPASDNIHWVPYNYEIWKSNGPLGSSAPIYIKIVYGVTTPNAVASQQGSILTPGIIMDVGTVNPSTGQIGGNHLSEIMFGFNSATGDGGSFECDFCAPNGDELAFIMWRNAAATSQSIPFVFFIDRTKDQSGNALGTFFTVGFVSANSLQGEYTVFNQQTGGVINYFPAAGNALGWTFPIIGATGVAYQGQTPVLPIFPIPGYVANPVLMAVAMKSGDFTDGQLINAVFYGGSHTFLMSKGNKVDQPQLNGAYPGIRWE